jgi:hypothetical protein
LPLAGFAHPLAHTQDCRPYNVNANAKGESTMNGQKVTEITICQLADLLSDSVELMNIDQGALRCHILTHPELGHITVVQNSSGDGGGFLVQTCLPQESTHHHAQSVLNRTY